MSHNISVNGRTGGTINVVVSSASQHTVSVAPVATAKIIGVRDARIDDGYLILVMDDGSEVNVGMVQGEPGEDGISIVGVRYDNDILFLQMSDGSEYTVGNMKGPSGSSPVITIENITGGHKVVFTDDLGQHSFSVMDGVIGPAGISPTVSVSAIDGGHSVTITDKDGDHQFDVLDNIPDVEEAQAIEFDDVPTDGSDNLLTSGAVKAALDAIPSGGGGDSWHFIRTVTLSTEHIDQDVNYWTDDDGNVCGFEFNKDQDGNEFMFNEIYCVGSLKTNVNQNSITLFNGPIRRNKTLAAFRGALTSTTYRQFQFETKIVDDKRFYTGEYCEQYKPSATRLSPVFLTNPGNPDLFRNYLLAAEPVSEISMYSGVTTAYYEGVMYFYGKN